MPESLTFLKFMTFLIPIIAIFLLCFAGVMDLRFRIIPNRVSVFLIILFFSFYGLSARKIDLPLHLLWGGITFLFLLGLYAINRLGGGDVKLLASAALWCGPIAGPEFLLLTSLFGGVLALVAIFPMSQALWEWAKIRFNLSESLFLFPNQYSVPYGLAIAVGASYGIWQAYVV
ncbi:A24 family peptidase [Sneathiella aquimaris]|uniref:A24 family peptidase n=1 Tax=Sneathiella aquimaris TaxID=2599305 RepID=UPI00146C2CEC|nr:prepilin peptidase [Sneathiella aquimaris]